MTLPPARSTVQGSGTAGSVITAVSFFGVMTHAASATGVVAVAPPLGVAAAALSQATVAVAVPA